MQKHHGHFDSWCLITNGTVCFHIASDYPTSSSSACHHLRRKITWNERKQTICVVLVKYVCGLLKFRASEHLIGRKTILATTWLFIYFFFCTFIVIFLLHLYHNIRLKLPFFLLKSLFFLLNFIIPSRAEWIPFSAGEYFCWSSDMGVVLTVWRVGSCCFCNRNWLMAPGSAKLGDSYFFHYYRRSSSSHSSSPVAE